MRSTYSNNTSYQAEKAIVKYADSRYHVQYKGKVLGTFFEQESYALEKAGKLAYEFNKRLFE